MIKLTIAEAYKLINNTLSDEKIIQRIKEKTGATRKSIVRKVRELQDNEGFGRHMSFKQPKVDKKSIQDIVEGGDLDELYAESTNNALLKENSKLKQVINKLSLEHGKQNIILDDIIGNVKSIKPFPMVYKPVKNNKKENATLVCMLADFHIGSCEEVPGFNKFNYNIACNRVQLFYKKLLAWCDLHRNSYTVDEICLVCLGDFISGDIHDELIRTNEFSSPEQVKKASELLSSLISSLAPHFKKVRVEFVTFDNHSRTTDKIQFSDNTNCYNYLVGHLTKALIQSIKNVEFNIHAVIQQIIKIQDRRYLIMHGNCVRGGGGASLFPMTGITRKLWRESHLRMNMNEDMHFDKILMGHYHSPIDTPDVSVAGCLVSTTGFDASAARHTPACITSFFVCGKYEFDYTPFWLNEGETY